MKRTIMVLVAISFSFLLMFGSPLYVSARGPGEHQTSYSRSQSLSMQMEGVITNIDNQRWTMSGGQVASAYVLGQQIDPGSGQLSYGLNSNIHGNLINGQAKVNLTASIDGNPIEVTGTLVISNMNGALCFPLPNPASGDCDSPDYLQPSILNNASNSGYTSAMPFVFEGDSSFTITGLSAQPITTTSGFAIEAPGDNLFGGPIVLASGDNFVVIVATYTTASARFNGVHMAGILGGSVGSNSVSGEFTEKSNIFENFVTGVQYQRGIINLQTNVSAINGNARISITTLSSYTNYISPLPLQPLTSGGIGQTADCSWAIGVEGTCQLAQLTSVGSIAMHTLQAEIESATISVWSIPSAAFVGQVTGTVTFPVHVSIPHIVRELNLTA